ncbi:hypothetical protein HK102_002322 [Quaeritorhiza haematococci]|nr:hypothetical protein HK102_002322 [Quaeritorhiza haematococci]
MLLRPEETSPRPQRARKAVERYSESTDFKEKKQVRIPEGKGVALKEIPHILEEIDKRTSSDDILSGFHTLIWGRLTHKHLKQDLRQFCGFDIKSEKEKELIVGKLGRWTMVGLKEFCEVLGLETSGTKDAIMDRIYEFLLKPHPRTPASKRKRTKSKSSHDNSDDETPAKPKKKKASTPKTPPPTAFDIFFDENNKTEDSSEDASEEDVKKALQEKWDAMSEEEKKPFEEKAAAAAAAQAEETEDGDASPVGRKTPKTPKSQSASKKKPSSAKSTKTGSAKKRAAPKSAKHAETDEDEEKDEVASEDEEKANGTKSSIASEKKEKESKKEEEAKKEEKKEEEPAAVDTPAPVEEVKEPSGPSSSEIELEIKRLLDEGDLNNLTSKKIREMLSDKFDVDLADRKGFIKEVIDRIMTQKRDSAET